MHLIVIETKSKELRRRIFWWKWMVDN